MSSASAPNSSPSSTPPPRYRGLRGAVAHAGLLLGIIAGIALIGAGILWLLTGRAPELYALWRVALLGVVLVSGAGLSRLICGGTADRLLPSGRCAKGDVASLGGLLIALFLPGYLAEYLMPATAAQEQPQLAIGQIVEIAGPTLDGGRFDLADHRGKVVLVDFGASWCGPCVAELPNVRRVYYKYHGDGLEVVGISLDFERAALVKFLEAHPQPWPQVFFDENGKSGFDNPLARRYGIQAIPCLLVIDQEGKLVARNVRGDQIGAAVAKALGKIDSTSFSDRLVLRLHRFRSWALYSVLESAWWFFVLCGLAGTVVLALTEATVRWALRRPGVEGASA